eukprot:2340542-Lingulodinium_polyedra.AAC.1
MRCDAMRCDVMQCKAMQCHAMPCNAMAAEGRASRRALGLLRGRVAEADLRGAQGVGWPGVGA